VQMKGRKSSALGPRTLVVGSLAHLLLLSSVGIYFSRQTDAPEHLARVDEKSFLALSVIAKKNVCLSTVCEYKYLYVSTLESLCIITERGQIFSNKGIITISLGISSLVER